MFQIAVGSVEHVIFLQLVKKWSDDLAGFFAAYQRYDFKSSTRASPSKYPFLKQTKIVAFHKLKTSRKIRFYPAIEVFEPSRQHSAAFKQCLVRG